MLYRSLQVIYNGDSVVFRYNLDKLSQDIQNDTRLKIANISLLPETTDYDIWFNGRDHVVHRKSCESVLVSYEVKHNLYLVRQCLCD